MSELAPEDLEEAYAKFWSKFTLPKFNYTVIDDPENLELLLFNRVT